MKIALSKYVIGYLIYLSVLLLICSCKKDGDITSPNILPTVLTDTLVEFTEKWAILSAKINPRGIQTSYYFEYGVSESLGYSTTRKVVGDGSAFNHVEDTVLNLTPSTRYYYRIVGLNSNGRTVGVTNTFTTKKVAVLPQYISDTVIVLNSSSALFIAKINSQGIPLTYYFEYGTTEMFGLRSIEKSIHSDSSSVVISDTVSGLSAATTYHYRLVLTTEFGKTMGVIKNFSTLFEFNFPLVTGTKWYYKYRYFTSDQATNYFSRVGYFTWEIIGKDVIPDSVIYRMQSVSVDTIHKWTYAGASIIFDTLYTDQKTVHFNIVISSTVIESRWDLTLQAPYLNIYFYRIPRFSTHFQDSIYIGDDFKNVKYRNTFGLVNYNNTGGSISRRDEHLELVSIIKP